MMPSFYKTDQDGQHYLPFNMVIPLTSRGFAILWDDFRLAEERQKSLARLYEELQKDGIFDRPPGKCLREFLFQEAVQRELAYVDKGRKLLLAFGQLEDITDKREPEDFVYPTTKSFTVRQGKSPLQAGV